MGEQSGGHCFFIAPIGPDYSEKRRLTDAIIKTAISPLANQRGMSVDASHQLDNPGSITNQVVRKLIDSELVVADLTDLNPNVMYELAIRHATLQPVVIIAETETLLPFDISLERTIFYDRDAYGISDLKDRLEPMMVQAINEQSSDNPVYRAQQDRLLRDIETSGASFDVSSHLIDRIESLENAIYQFSNQSIPTGLPPIRNRPKKSYFITFKSKTRSALEEIFKHIELRRSEPINPELHQEDNWYIAKVFDIPLSYE